MKKTMPLNIRKNLSKKRDTLYRILLDDGGNVYACEEAINILLEVFGEVDLTIAQQEQASVKILATTLNNEDSINALLEMVRFYTLSSKGKISDTVKIKARPDVAKTKTILLSEGENLKTYLLIDVYDETAFYYDENAFHEIIQLLSLITKVSVIETIRATAYKVDSLTRIYTRDTLIRDLKKQIDLNTKDYYETQLAVIYISNGSTLNNEKGYQYVDKCLLNIAKLLMSRIDGGYVYRIGSMKFAALIKAEVQDAVDRLQSILDRLQDIDRELNFSIMVLPIQKDAYETVYIAEKHIKELESNVITMCRGNPEDFLCDDYLGFAEVILPKDEEITYVENADFEKKESVFSPFTAETGSDGSNSNDDDDEEEYDDEYDDDEEPDDDLVLDF